MTRDELEFSISQYLDGALPPLERAVVDETLANSAEARAVLAEFEKLNGLLKRASAVAVLDWEKVHAQFTDAIAQAEPPAITTYRIGVWARWTGAVAAVAASIALVFSLQLRRPADETAGPRTPLASAGSVHVSISGPGAIGLGSLSLNVATLPAVSVGPSPQMASMSWGYDDSIVTRPQRIVIAGDAQPVQDGGAAPF